MVATEAVVASVAGEGVEEAVVVVYYYIWKIIFLFLRELFLNNTRKMQNQNCLDFD